MHVLYLMKDIPLSSSGGISRNLEISDSWQSVLLHSGVGKAGPQAAAHELPLTCPSQLCLYSIP